MFSWLTRKSSTKSTSSASHAGPQNIRQSTTPRTLMGQKKEAQRERHYKNPLRQTLYHQTDSQSAKLILNSGIMKSGSSGLAGPGMYFTISPEHTQHKAQKKGVVIVCDVWLGNSKTVDNSCPWMTIQKLLFENRDSVQLQRSAGYGHIGGTEYVVYESWQVYPRGILGKKLKPELKANHQDSRYLIPVYHEPELEPKPESRPKRIKSSYSHQQSSSPIIPLKTSQSRLSKLKYDIFVLVNDSNSMNTDNRIQEARDVVYSLVNNVDELDIMFLSITNSIHNGTINHPSQVDLIFNKIRFYGSAPSALELRLQSLLSYSRMKNYPRIYIILMDNIINTIPYFIECFSNPKYFQFFFVQIGDDNYSAKYLDISERKLNQNNVHTFTCYDRKGKLLEEAIIDHILDRLG